MLTRIVMHVKVRRKQDVKMKVGNDSFQMCVSDGFGEPDTLLLLKL